MAEKIIPGYVIDTVQRLGCRIRERFPDATLARTADSLLEVAQAAVDRTRTIGRPILWVRFPILLLILAIPVFVSYELWTFDLPFAPQKLGDLVAFFQSAVESMIFLGLGIVFLVSFETRIKRRRAVAAIHELRELAHIVDMHQLDKDPVYLLEKGARTESSPERTLSAFELNRYLDYCSEMLSLIGKVAALYGQRIADPIALESVDNLESLTNGLSRKIWQKVTILERAAG